MKNTIENQLAYITTLINYLDQNEPVEKAVISKISYHGLEIELHKLTLLKSNFQNFLEIYETTRNYELSDYEEEIYADMLQFLKANHDMLITALLETKVMDELIENNS